MPAAGRAGRLVDRGGGAGPPGEGVDRLGLAADAGEAAVGGGPVALVEAGGRLAQAVFARALHFVADLVHGLQAGLGAGAAALAAQGCLQGVFDGIGQGPGGAGLAQAGPGDDFAHGGGAVLGDDDRGEGAEHPLLRLVGRLATLIGAGHELHGPLQGHLAGVQAGLVGEHRDGVGGQVCHREPEGRRYLRARVVEAQALGHQGIHEAGEGRHELASPGAVGAGREHAGEGIAGVGVDAAGHDHPHAQDGARNLAVVEAVAAIGVGRGGGLAGIGQAVAVDVEEHPRTLQVAVDGGAGESGGRSLGAGVGTAAAPAATGGEGDGQRTAEKLRPRGPGAR